MKRFFKFALVALATAAVAVACQKPEQQPEKIALKGISLNKPAVELAIGAKETLTVKFDPENVTEKPTIEWSSSAPAVATVAEGEVTAVAAGEATITAKAGSFTATCKVTVKGEEQPEPGDFTSPDWANIGAITNGNHTFKFTKDDKFAYFYTERPKDDRFGELWGDGVGYVYYAFDFDGDLTTGEELLGNGKYEYIAYIYCFGGSADAPEIKITAEGGVAPSSYSIANVIAKGTVDANGLKLEYAVPLSDLPQLPEKFTIYTWGNKSLSKVEYKYPYEAPAPVDNWDYTPSAEYLAATNLWKPADGPEAVHWTLGDGLATPEVTFSQSTYTFTLAEASDDIQSTQFRVVSNNITLDPAKKYNFYCKVYSSAGTKLWLKAHPDPNTHWPELFETAGYDVAGDRMVIEAGETKEIALENIEASLYPEIITKQCIMFDLSPHAANNLIHIKDIIVEEVGGGVPPSVLNVDVLDMEFTAVDKTSNSYFDWSDRAGAASTAIYAGQSSTGTGQYIQLRTKNNNSGIITTASGGKLRQVTVAFNSATTDRKINVYAKNTAYTSPTDLYDDTKAGTLLGSIQAGSGNYTIDVTDDYAFVGLRSADGAIYVDKIEIAWEPSGDVPPAPTGIKIDGDFSDWDGIEAFASEATSRIREWKISSDNDNVYVYVAMRKNRAESSKKLVIGFNTDNDAATGSLTDNNNMKGCEAIARNIIPFISSTEGITGADSGSEVVSTAGATETGVVVVNAVPGTEDASSDSANCYLELSIPKAKLALPATAISVGCSYDYYFTGYKSVTL